jgi:2-polyprenyl-6-methoxyphenol hydroxylase-like FAD-dependent oxidoreductase
MKKSILIVGAGPGGLIAALTLVRFGIQPIIIEKNKERTSFTKALSLQPRTLEIIDHLSLLERYIDCGKRIQRTNYHVNKKHVGTVDYGQLPSKCNHLLSITQPDSERVFEEALQAEGIFVQRGVECIDFMQTPDRCFSKIRNIDKGTEETLESDYVIAADGGRSFLRSLLLKKKEVQLLHEVRYNSNFIMGDFAMEEYPYLRDERNTFFGNNAICGLIPMRDPYVRIVAFGLRKSVEQSPTIEEFDEVLQKIVGKKFDLQRGEWLSRFYPSRFMVDRFRVGNLFLVGDAAHIISPIGAQGINLSIEDAYNLGWKLGMVIAQKADSTLLDTYESDRKSAASVVLKETNALHRKLSNSFLNFFFMQQLKFLKKPDVNRFVMQKQTQFFIDYPNMDIKQNKKKPETFYSGGRLINGRCKWPPNVYFFDLLSKHKLTLLFNFLSFEWTERQLKKTFFETVSFSSICFPLSILNDSLVDSDTSESFCRIASSEELVSRLKSSPFFLLVSPDHYVRKTYSIENSQALLNYFDSLMGDELLVKAEENKE